MSTATAQPPVQGKPKSKKLLKQAVHQHRALSKRGLMERFFTFWFGGFVYNQIWEDPRVDAEAMRLDEDARILTISSGGCNVLNYLVHQPDRVVAVDLNRCHMSLTRLKLAGLRHLPSYEAFFAFFAHGRDEQNLERYERYIREHLDPDALAFWEKRRPGGKRIKYYVKGIYDYSKLGLLLRFTHRVARILGKNPQELLDAETIEDQQKFFDEVVEPFFDNRLVKWMGRSPLTGFSLGIPPSQAEVMKREADKPMVDIYRDRVRKLTCQFPIQENYFAWQAYGRRYDLENRQALPDYLREENYEGLRAAIDRVETHVTSFDGYLREQPDSTLNRFVLLDAQDWMPPEVIAALWTEIARVGEPGSRVIFRTAGFESPIETALPADLRAKFVYERELSAELHEKDRSAIYGMFHVYSMPE
ncbi:MAG: DUF3419 family protein [Phycisphaera sp.]|nr:DUF3419 family protein [Phycisphaera sp.]